MAFRIEDLVSMPFDKSVFSCIQEATNRILALSNEMDYITLMDNNFQAFNYDIVNTTAYGRVDFKRINCSFSNFFSSFYLWKEYHKHHYGDIFNNILIRYRERNAIFSLGEEMRHYSAHVAFAITKVEYDGIKEIRCLPIDAQILLKRAEVSNHKLNASLRAWLTEKKENAEPIEAEWLVFEFYQICTEIQNELWSGYIEQIHKDLETIARYFPEGFSNVYNVSISSEDQATHFGLGQIIACFLKKAAWQYPKFIPNLYLGKF